MNDREHFQRIIRRRVLADKHLRDQRPDIDGDESPVLEDADVAQSANYSDGHTTTSASESVSPHAERRGGGVKYPRRSSDDHRTKSSLWVSLFLVNSLLVARLLSPYVRSLADALFGFCGLFRLAV